MGLPAAWCSAGSLAATPPKEPHDHGDRPSDVMSKDLKTHSAHLELNEPAPAELPVGSDFVLQVKLSCPAGCDLGTMPLAVTGPDGQVATFAPAFDQEAAPSEVVAREIALQAPQQVGEHVWVIRFLPQERAGLRHEEC